MKPGRCKKELPEHHVCGFDAGHEGDCGEPWRPWARGNFLPAPHAYRLDQAVLPLVSAFGQCIYQVGSSLHTRDYRDVDVRAILSDEQFARLFPNGNLDALLSVMTTAISAQLSLASGLPIDFQFQKQSEANARFDGSRSAVGIFCDYQGEKPKESTP
jgi:hypothetical protein